MGSSSRPRSTLSTNIYHHYLKANQPEVSELERLKVVHVAGTKGKGSTCTFVNSILLAHQGIHGIPHKIDLYASPYLIAVRERIRIKSELFRSLGRFGGVCNEMAKISKASRYTSDS